MAEHDISLVTAKSSNTVIESMKVALATASAAITPATLTAMVGIKEGSALALPKSVTDAMTILNTHKGYANANVAGWIAGISGPTGTANAALTNLTTLQGQLGFTGSPGSDNHAAFGAILNQAHGHIDDSIEINNATTFMSSTSFEEMGAGITNMSSMATQGLDGALGDLGSAASAFEAAGPVFDLNKISSLGSTTGFVDKLNSVKLGNASGVNAAIAAAGLDITNPEHAPAISKIVGSIKDPAIIATIQDQLKISPGGAIGNLNDFTNLSKLAPAGSALAALPTTGMPDLSAMASKFSDMGAKFANPAAAAGLLNGIQIPSIPDLNSFAPTLSGLTSSLSDGIANMTGKAFGLSALNGANGLPNITDFTHAVSGGPELSALANVGNIGITADHITALTDSITKSQGLMATAGIDITSPLPLPSLGSAMSFATSLHKFGADTAGSGISDVLGGMANPGSAFGDSIKASLAEGKNKALMAAHGISPLKFGS
jgi:hypothetical protein